MRILLCIFYLLCLTHAIALGQGLPIKDNDRAKPKVERPDSIPKPLDGEPLSITDTINIPINVKYAQEPLECKIEYDARDSMLFNVIENKLNLNFLTNNLDLRLKKMSH